MNSGYPPPGHGGTVATRRVKLPGSERQPLGNRVGALSDDEIIEISVILKPKSPVEIPRPGGPVMSREEFAAKYGADPAAIEKVRAFAREHSLNHDISCACCHSNLIFVMLVSRF